MVKPLLLSLSAFLFLLCGGRSAGGDLSDAGVVTSIRADRFTIKVDSGWVYVMYPDKNVVAGHSPRLIWPPEDEPEMPSPEIPFSALRRGMRVFVDFRLDPKDHSKATCTLLTKDTLPPLPNDVRLLKERVYRLEKEVADLRRQNHKMRTQVLEAYSTIPATAETEHEILERKLGHPPKVREYVSVVADRTLSLHRGDLIAFQTPPPPPWAKLLFVKKEIQGSAVKEVISLTPEGAAGGVLLKHKRVATVYVLASEAGESTVRFRWRCVDKTGPGPTSFITFKIQVRK